MKEKLKHLPAELKIILLEKEDIILTSGGGGTNYDPENEDSGGWT